MNVDRTSRNTNMLMWNKELWLIDHGAALYFHHSWEGWKEKAVLPFTHDKHHVLLSMASALTETDKEFRSILNADLIDEIVAGIPGEWLIVDSPFTSVDQHRDAYAEFLKTRILHSEIFVKHAQDERAGLI
jgi:hypothetical protein